MNPGAGLPHLSPAPQPAWTQPSTSLPPGPPPPPHGFGRTGLILLAAGLVTIAICCVVAVVIVVRPGGISDEEAVEELITGYYDDLARGHFIDAAERSCPEESAFRAQHREYEAEGLDGLDLDVEVLSVDIRSDHAYSVIERDYNGERVEADSEARQLPDGSWCLIDLD